MNSKDEINRPELPSEALPALVSLLDREYYSHIEAFCSSAGKKLAFLLEQEQDATLTGYIGLSRDLINQVERYLQFREEVLVPYILELAGKEAGGHDCRSCTGKCSLQHAGRLAEVKSAHDGIRETLQQLQQSHLPPFTGKSNGVFRLLRNEIMLLETALHEVLREETARLIPLIADAQKHIHA